MRARERQIALVVLLALVVALGVALDLAERDGVGDEERAPLAAARLVERAVFCPPAAGDDTRLTQLAAASSRRAPGVLDVTPDVPRGISLGPRQYLAHSSRSGRAQDVVGYGAPPVAAAVAVLGGGVKGAGAAPCSPLAAPSWYLPQGSSLLGHDERILIYNPFPDDAVVKVIFVTPRGERAPANAADVAVPARASRVLRVNEFILREPVLAAFVTATRGRVVAWRAMSVEAEGSPEGVEMSLGASSPAPVWYFPQGEVGQDVEETISVMNPSPQEAVLSILLATDEEIVQPPRLAQLRLPPETSISIPLPEALTRAQASLGDVSAVVRSTNGVPVVAERRTLYASGEPEGREAEVGAPHGATRWFLGPPFGDASVDVVTLLNPGSAGARASISLLDLRGGRPTPSARRTIRVPGGLQRQIDLDDVSQGEPVAVLVEATRPLVAERLSYSADMGDVVTVMGVALPGAP